MKILCCLFLLLTISACGTTAIQCEKPVTGDKIYVVQSGWHAEVGIPVEKLEGDMKYFREVFPAAKVIMFGYGKKTFFTAAPEDISEYVIGPFPGTAVIHAVGLSVLPPEAYPDKEQATLAMPKGGAHALSNFIWTDLAKDPNGKPHVVARSNNPDGLFYAAQSRYNLLHTCNTWTANALQDAGLHVSGDGVVFAHQVMSQVNKAGNEQCASK